MINENDKFNLTPKMPRPVHEQNHKKPIPKKIDHFCENRFLQDICARISQSA